MIQLRLKSQSDMMDAKMLWSPLLQLWKLNINTAQYMIYNMEQIKFYRSQTQG